VESLVTPLSWQLLKFYQRIWSKSFNSTEEYLNFPCIIDDAIDVITAELNEINRVKAKKEKNDVEAAQRKLSGKRRWLWLISIKSR